MPKPSVLNGSTRGIRPATPMTGGASGTTGSVPAATGNPASASPRARPDAAPASSLTVGFATGSAELTPQAIEQLGQLGKALSGGAMAGFRFRIEGHTDSVGGKEANLALSERRAQAVATFLESKFGISRNRIEPVGMGFDQPLVPTPAQTAEPRNRRVQVINLGA